MALNVNAQITGQSDDFVTWGPVNTKIVIDILLEEVNKGSMEKGQFDTKRWQPMLQEVCARTKKEYSMDQLKHKFNNLRLHHRVFSELIENTDSGWDSVTNNVTVPHDCWDNYLKAHPDARRFRKNGLDRYKELGTILENIFINSRVHVKVDNYGAEDGLYKTQNYNVVEKYREIVGGGIKKRKRFFVDEKEIISDAFLSWTDVCKAKVEWYRRRMSVKCTTSDPKLDYSIAKCMRELDAMEFIDMSVYVKAVELFMKVEYREVFLSMAVEKRLFWITALYNANS